MLAGLLFSALVIFLIGDERRLFESSVEFRAKFTDVQGLKGGAPVRMGGVDIGHVGTVGYGKTAGDTTIYVSLSIVRAEASRIKTDSIARVAAKGLLGDKMIEITRGVKPEAVPPGGDITSEEPSDMFGKVAGMADKADATLGGLQKVAENLANEKLHQDLRESVASLNNVLKQVSEGEGYPHRLIADKQEAERISHLISSLDHTATEMNATLAEVRKVAARVESGPGFTHDVIYGDGPKKEIAQFGNAAQELALTLKGVRESDSLAHDILYGGKGNGAEAIANVTAITADLRAITADMRKGKGTIGALLVDPSVYEDMKVLLGNVQRNDVLRALVRYSIKQDEKKPEVKVEQK
ncbi:Mammalian cell entry related domain protein [Minicystis rosea]|nr:Mammalian cell entry related domain protein [Minicystis rosea]